MQERSEQTNQVVEEYDNVTKLYGHKPTNEQILEMARHKGIVYQRKGKEGTNKSQPNFPKVTTPTNTPITNLTVDLGSWISKTACMIRVLHQISSPRELYKGWALKSQGLIKMCVPWTLEKSRLTE
jgi:hypothetical protein